MRDLIESLKLERKLRLGTNTVEALRKEFLTLMKNVKRLRDAKGAYELKTAMSNWGKRFGEYAKQISDDLRDRGSRDPKANKGWVEQHQKNIGVVWDFAWEAEHMSLESWEYIKKYSHKYDSAEEVYQDSKEDIRKWANRTKRKAVAAWKWMKEVSKWAESEGLQGGGGRSIVLRTADRENIKIEGFRMQIVGYDEDEEFHAKGMGKVKAALRTYKTRAQKVYPWLIKYQLPLVLYFEGGNNRDSAAATYEKDHITMTMWGIHSGSPQEGARVLAHEMGHHLFQAVLSGKAKKAWTDFIRSNYTKLDLRKVVAMLKPGEDLNALDKRIEKTQPILHLQLQTLMQTDSGRNLYSLVGIKDYLDRGEDPIFHVPQIPISGYAAKNPEEAFCEALGILVGYGPRAVLPPVLRMLRSLAGGVKLEGKLESRDIRSLITSLRP